MNFARGCARVIPALVGIWLVACLALLWFMK